jgi:beta-glucanase (GH16 family)
VAPVRSAGAVGDQFSGSRNSAASGTFWSTTTGTGWDPGIQNYTGAGAVLDGQGHLVIQATGSSSGAWTSGRVETANKLSLGYGTISARIKVPKGQGLWPAFWLTGADAATNG